MGHSLIHVSFAGQTTRIILIFLAVTDLGVMVLELFVHYIPYYWRWFPIFFTNIGCGVAFLIQGTAITMSSWYIMLMTVERFIVVWFPMKVRKALHLKCLSRPY